MFTLFDIFELLGPLAGAAIGALIGIRFGTPSAVIGAVVGIVAGRLFGKLPTFLMLKSLHRSLSQKSTEQLRAELRTERCLIPNVIILELSSRGENIMQYLPVVLDLLESEDSSRRGFGWAAITSAFPDLAHRISGYRLDDTIDECKRKLQILRDLTEQTHAEATSEASDA